MVVVCGAVLAALAPGVWYWVSQDARDWEPNAAKPGEEGPSIVASGVQLFEAREPSGKRAWRFAARSIELSSDKRWASLDQVEKAVLFRDGKPYLEMSARQVRFDQQTRDWTAEGALKVQGPDGLKIDSEQAAWKQGDQALECPGAVKARFKGADIETIGLRYNARQNELRAQNPVTLRGEHIHASASTIVADTRSRKVHFPNGVDLTIDPPLLEKYGLKR